MNNAKKGHTLLLLSVAAAACGADLLTKYLAEKLLGAEPLPLLGGIVILKKMHNTGIAFGMLGNIPVLSYALPVALMVVFWLLFRQFRLNRLQTVLCGLIAGGFAGNFIDRLLHGSVTDFLFFSFLPWFICNLADIFVVLCGIGLMVQYLIHPKSWILKKEDEADA